MNASGVALAGNIAQAGFVPAIGASHPVLPVPHRPGHGVLVFADHIHGCVTFDALIGGRGRLSASPGLKLGKASLKRCDALRQARQRFPQRHLLKEFHDV